jgi:hypothetical protein
MDGKRTNFDLRRRNMDDEFSPDTSSSSKLDSVKADPTKDDTRDRYDRSFLADRGLLRYPQPN